MNINMTTINCAPIYQLRNETFDYEMLVSPMFDIHKKDFNLEEFKDTLNGMFSDWLNNSTEDENSDFEDFFNEFYPNELITRVFVELI